MRSLIALLILLASPGLAQRVRAVEEPATRTPDTRGATSWQVSAIIPNTAQAKSAALLVDCRAWQRLSRTSDCDSIPEIDGNWVDGSGECVARFSASGEEPATHCGRSEWATAALRDRYVSYYGRLTGASVVSRLVFDASPSMTIDGLASRLGLQRIAPEAP